MDGFFKSKTEIHEFLEKKRQQKRTEGGVAQLVRAPVSRKHQSQKVAGSTPASAVFKK